MSYSIKISEPLPKAVHRIISSQVAMAKDALQKTTALDEGIHKARKHFKKIRALLRLVRDELGEKVYQQQNSYYRDLGRELSQWRDASAVLESLSLLKNQFEKQLKAQTFQQLENYLINERAGIRKEKNREEKRIEKVLQDLTEAKSMTAALKISGDYPKLLKSHKRVYKRGYKAFTKSFDSPDMEAIHEWRKRAKYLWCQYRLLKPAWHPVLKGFAKEAHRLSDLIGDHRDMALLKQKMRTLEAKLEAENLRVIEALATQYQENVFHKAQLLGAKIYAEKPGKYTKRLTTYLKNWHALSQFP